MSKLPPELQEALKGLGDDVRVAKPDSPEMQLINELGTTIVLHARLRGMPREVLAFALFHLALNAMVQCDDKYQEGITRLASDMPRYLETYRRIKEATSND